MDIIEDGDGLWMGTHDGGVVFYDGSNWVTWATDDGLGGNDTRAIQQDGSGALWFIHEGSGVSRYDPVDTTWQAFGSQEGAIDWPSTPGVDSEGHLWVGGYETLKWYDGQDWRALEPTQLAEETVFALVAEGGCWGQHSYYSLACCYRVGSMDQFRLAFPLVPPPFLYQRYVGVQSGYRLFDHDVPRRFLL